MSAKAQLKVSKEVADYISKDEKIAKFRAEHYEVFTHLGKLIEERNAARVLADKVVRASGEPQGPWGIHSQRVDINAELLFKRLGSAKFEQVGGTISMTPTYSVDKQTFDSAVALKKVSEKVLEEVREVKVSWKGPKDIET